VTAFIIESYKGLRQDSGDISALILQRILVQLESSPNGTTSSPPVNITQVPFSPTPSDIHVNILWFLSLILSLSTVLIGIVALQWLREHLRSRPELEPQIGFSYHHMSSESLDSWYLPQVFTALPLLLLLALVFFLVGVVEFLCNLNYTVAIPAAVAICMSLLFLLGTTLLPTLQALSLFLPRRLGDDKPRSPCPYRSPQSWAFHQLLRPLIATLLRTLRYSDGDWRPQSHDLLSPSPHDIETYLDRQRRPTKLIFRQNRRDTWTEFGIAWLFQRDLDAMGRETRLTHIASSDMYRRPVPVYDTVQGVVTADADGASRNILLAQHCVEPIAGSNEVIQDYQEYLYFLVSSGGLDRESVNVASSDVLKDHIVLASHLLIGVYQPTQRSRMIEAELGVRIAHAMFADGPKTPHGIWTKPWSPLISINPETSLGEHGNVQNLPTGCQSDIFVLCLGFQFQLLDILRGYFQHAALYYPNTANLENSTYLSSAVGHFLYACADFLPRLKPTSSIFSRHQDLLQSLASGLGSTHTGVETDPPPDHLFFSSLIYVTRLLNQGSETITTETGQELILAIFQYRSRFHPQDDIMEIMSTWIEDPPAFDRVWSGFVGYASELGIVLPAIAEEQTTGLTPECVEGKGEPQHPLGDAVVDVGKTRDQISQDESIHSLHRDGGLATM